MKIYIVRHGETDWNKEHKVQGKTDILLNSNGIESALELQSLVKNLNIDAVFSSPYIRTLDTAKIITNNKYDIVVDERLKERDWGLNEGKSIDNVDTVDCWNVFLNIEKNNIERIQDFMNRVASFIEEIKIKYSKGNVLIVTHSAVVRVFHYLLGTIPQDGDLTKINIPNLRILEIDI